MLVNETSATVKGLKTKSWIAWEDLLALLSSDIKR
jgi:hypothetical protein